MKQLPEIVKGLLDWEAGPWLAGGAALWAVDDQLTVAPKDFDLYFRDSDSRARTRAALIEAGADPLVLDYAENWEVDGVVIQLVKQPYPMREAVLANFDLTICQVLTDGTRVLQGPLTPQHLSMRAFGLGRVTDPRYTLWRAMKYAGKGYRPMWSVAEGLVAKVLVDPESVGSSSGPLY